MTRGFNPGLDAVRVGACFMVVVLHVAAVNFHVFDYQWWASNFYDSLTRSCVPVFLMISGALLLSRQESLGDFLSKRFARIIPPLLFWSLFYMGWNTLHGTDYGALGGWLTELLNGPVVFHLWYLYAIVGIYLFVPFLRRVWNASHPSEKKLYLALWALASCWPTLEAALEIDVDLLGNYELHSFFGLAGYLFLGAYVHDRYHEQANKARYWLVNAALFLVFSVLTMAATFAYSRKVGAPDGLFYEYLSPLVMASSVCAFNVLFGLGRRFAGHSSPVQQISACTLGIYCIHIFVMERFEHATGLLSAGASQWWAIPATAVCVFGLSLASIMLLRRMRPFRHVT